MAKRELARPWMPISYMPSLPGWVTLGGLRALVVPNMFKVLDLDSRGMGRKRKQSCQATLPLLGKPRVPKNHKGSTECSLKTKEPVSLQERFWGRFVKLVI
jgi:hypothetical protein